MNAAELIASRLKRTPAEAAEIVALLSGDEVDLVECAERNPQGAVAIATAVYLARLRAVRKIADPAARHQAQRAANVESIRHHKVILATTPEPCSEPMGPAAPRGIRVVRTPVFTADAQEV